MNRKQESVLDAVLEELQPLIVQLETAKIHGAARTLHDAFDVLRSTGGDELVKMPPPREVIVNESVGV